MPGAPAGTTRAPALASSSPVLGHQDYVIKTLLHGLTGPVNGTTYTEVMVAMGQSPDDWIAAIASYVRNSFGNRASMVSAADVARVRAATASRKNKSWTTAELEGSLPKLVGDGWKLTASYNPAIASQALGINPWTSGHAQQPLGFPRDYQVQVSMDGTTWGQPVARGKGAGTLTDIAFPPVRAKFVRLTQSGTADAPWTIQRLRLYEPGAAAAGTR